MRTEDNVIKEYTKSDRVRRLNLYLQYRDLRGAFVLVEEKERHLEARKIFDSNQTDKKTAGYHRPTGWRRFLPHGFVASS